MLFGIYSSKSFANDPWSPYLQLTYLPAWAWTKTASIEADWIESPWAKNPAIIPAKTSPVPAVAKDGLANGLTKMEPVGRATMVLDPFRTIMVWD